MDKDLKELQERIIRIESRIVQLGDHVGANLRTKQRIEIIRSPTGAAVEIDSLDVSLSRVYTELTHAGVPVEDVNIWHKGRIVATLS